MLYLGTTPLAGNIKTKLFTSSGTFVVPADVECIWVDGSGPGGGGGGGDPTPGGGGSGGGMGGAVRQFPFVVEPSETLTIVIGAVGVGGSAGNNGTTAGSTYISGSRFSMGLQPGQGGIKGTPSAGGATIAAMFSSYGAVSDCSPYILAEYPSYFAVEQFNAQALFYTAPGAGAGLSANSSARMGKSIQALNGAGFYTAGAIGGVLGGGGGHGALNAYVGSNVAGVGGSNGGAGTNGSGYGSGGGGGSGNSAGGNGAPGFIRLFMLTTYTI